MTTLAQRRGKEFEPNWYKRAIFCGNSQNLLEVGCDKLHIDM